MVNERWLCNPSHRFLKKFNLSTLSACYVSNEWRSRCSLHDHGGLSSSLQSHNERPSQTVGVAATAMGIDEEAEKNRKESDCEKICKLQFVTSVHFVLFSVYWPFALQNLTPVICHAVSKHCLGSFLWQNMFLSLNVLAFLRQILKLFHDHLSKEGHRQLKTTNSGSNVKSLCRQSISGWNDLL